MGAWRGSVFTSGHVLSLGLGNSIHGQGEQSKQDAILCTRSLRV